VTGLSPRTGNAVTRAGGFAAPAGCRGTRASVQATRVAVPAAPAGCRGTRASVQATRVAVSLLISAVVLGIAGCASVPDGSDAAGGDVAAAVAEVSTVPLPTSVVRYGVALSLPDDARVFDQFGGAPVDPIVPRGVITRFETGDAAVVGAIQVVPIPGAVRQGETRFLPLYFETYDLIDGSPEYVSIAGVPNGGGADSEASGGDAPHREIAVATPVADPTLAAPADGAPGATEDPASSMDRVLVATFVPFNRRLSETHGILLEIEAPRNRVTEAVAIAAALDLPEEPEGLVRSGRVRRIASSDPVELAFFDDTGRWSWVADTHHGFVLRRRRDGHDLYVAVDLWDAVTVPPPVSSTPGNSADEDPDEDPDDDASPGSDRFSLEFSYDSWRWEIPFLPRHDGDRRRWTGRVPDADGELDLRVDIIEPGRAWTAGDLGVAEVPALPEIIPEIQALFDRAVSVLR